MNGAILGMTKQEIDAKMEEIIEFSEVREFIDTPVKRYSSGMFVKLAFSVAAHLDAEIMIMDEVLAVGDMAFQTKCLDKMREAANKDGRTVLYVSHNMNTIRKLCDRCIVLDKGKVVFNGDVDKAIELYLGKIDVLNNHYVFSKEHHKNVNSTNDFVIESLNICDKQESKYELNEKVKIDLFITTLKKYKEIRFRVVFRYKDSSLAGTMLSIDKLDFIKGRNTVEMELDTAHLMKGQYRVDIIAFMHDDFGNEQVIDGVYPGMFIELVEKVDEKQPIMWLHQYWGHVRLNDLKAKVK